MLALVSGLVAGLSLIVAIGAQNSFVLRQGLRRHHVLLVVAVCALSDAVLIAAGVAGLGAIVTRAPVVLTIITWAGAAFLLTYGIRAGIRAFKGSVMTEAEDANPPHWSAALLTTLALTWLNPHVYLDTVLLLGSMASGHGAARWWFAGGAMLGSIVWFTALGFGARVLAPIFRRRRAWQVLDGLIAVIMIALAIQLLVSWSTA